MFDADFAKQKQQVMAILGIALILFLAYKLLLPYYHSSQFQVEVQKISNWDRENYLEPPRPETIKKKVLKAAHKRGFNLNRRNIKMHYEHATTIIIKVNYSIPIDLLVRKFDWAFNFTVKTEEVF